MSEPTEQRGDHRLTIVLAVHVFLGFLVSTRAWYLEEDWAFLTLVSIPCAQCSLVAVWVATSRVPDYLSFPVMVVGGFACWYELSTLISWGAAGTSAMLWLVLLGYQTLFVLSWVTAVRWLFQRRANGNRKRFSFRLRTLHLWTAVVAIALMFFNYGKTNWGWSHEWMRSGVHTTILLFALFNSAVACAWATVWKEERMRPVLGRILVAVFAIVVACWLTSRAVDQFGVALGANALLGFYITAVAQSVILGATFASARRLRLVPGQDGSSDTKEGSVG